MSILTFANEALPLPIMVPFIPLTTSAGNTLIGLNSDPAMTSGILNVAVGEYTLTSNTIGSYNAAYGANAMQFNISGQNNVGIGYRSLYNLISGSGNISMGSLCGNDIVTGSGNIILGNMASAGSSGASNRIVMGNLATGIYDNCFHIIGGSTPITDFCFPDLATTTPLANVLYYDTVTGKIMYGNNNGGNSTFTDDLFRIQNAATTTKQLAFNCVNISAATTRTFTIPNANGVLPAIVNTTNLALGNVSYSFSSDNNTAIGVDAGANMTTATNNTALGYQALNTSTNTASNVAVGNQALYSATSSNNSAVGDQVLYSLIGGSDNSAMGSSAAYSLTSGQYNVAMGAFSLYTGTSCTGNIAVGYYSLYNSTANSNTAVGYQSMVNAIAATQCVALGYQALNGVTSGVRNIGVGAIVGANITTGANNIFMGYGITGRTSADSNNIVIGNNAQTKFSGVDGVSNGCVNIESITANRGFFTNAIRPASNAYVLLYDVASGEITYGTDTESSTFVDSLFRVQNTSDVTKQFALNCANISTATTRTFTIPDNNGIFPTLPNSTSLATGATGYTFSGVSNTLYGVASGASLTNGTYNTAVGHQSLNQNVTGQGCVAVGYQACRLATISGATALGYQALTALTTGLYNTSVGYQALLSCVTGNYNTSMGYQALAACTGNNNTAVGYQSQTATLSGGLNTSVGLTTLQSLTTGNSNTALGAQALQSVITGSDNTAVGAGAGTTLTGSNNVLVGSGASTQATTTNNSIVVGYAVSGKAGVITGNGNNVVTIQTPVANVGMFCNSLRSAAGTSTVQYIEATGELTYTTGSSSGNSGIAFSVVTTNAALTTAYTQPVATGKTVLLIVNLAALNSTSTTGGSYIVKASFRNNSGVVSQISSTITETFADSLTWTVSYSISGTNVLFRVSGALGVTINWAGFINVITSS